MLLLSHRLLLLLMQLLHETVVVVVGSGVVLFQVKKHFTSFEFLKKKEIKRERERIVTIYF
jgi:hypothetical protein